MVVGGKRHAPAALPPGKTRYPLYRMLGGLQGRSGQVRNIWHPPEYSSTLSLTSALDGVGGQRHAPAASAPGKARHPLYRRLGGPQGRSGRVRKISPPPGFDPRIVQPVTSRYTDWAIPARTHITLNDTIFQRSIR
jgi:hypothetical protein